MATMTLTALAARYRAVSAPMPRDEPVTSATFPARSLNIGTLVEKLDLMVFLSFRENSPKIYFPKGGFYF
jgi:hypothetical protein